MGKYRSHNSDICMEYNETVLPDEEGNCSLCGAMLRGTAIVYSKIWSTNPNLYKEMNQKEALDGYIEYLNAYAKSTIFEPRRAIVNLGHAKSFDDWLNTEI